MVSFVLESGDWLVAVVSEGLSSFCLADGETGGSKKVFLIKEESGIALQGRRTIKLLSSCNCILKSAEDVYT